MKTLIIKTTGLSIKELKEKYPKLFYAQDWYDYQAFYTEKPQAGTYEIVIEKALTSMEWEEQFASLESGQTVLHAAQYIEGMINQFNLTGEMIFKDWYVRTSVLGSDGRRVRVGNFDFDGLLVRSWSGDGLHDDVGLSAGRKLDDGISNLESAIREVKKAGYLVYKAM